MSDHLESFTCLLSESEKAPMIVGSTNGMCYQVRHYEQRHYVKRFCKTACLKHPTRVTFCSAPASCGQCGDDESMIKADRLKGFKAEPVPRQAWMVDQEKRSSEFPSPGGGALAPSNNPWAAKNITERLTGWLPAPLAAAPLPEPSSPPTSRTNSRQDPDNTSP